MSKNFLQTSSLLALICLSLFSFSAKAMDPGEERSHSHALTTNLAWEERFQRLEEENIILRTTIGELKEKLYPSNPLRAVFRNQGTDWVPYVTSKWTPVTFSLFEGNERLRGDFSTIKIPEDGLYNFYAHYAWRANTKGNTTSYTSIAINTPENGYESKNFEKHHLASGFEAIGGLNRNISLNRGDKVMLSIYSSPNAEYYFGHFILEVAKIY